MKILLASSEVHPYSKTGGLADMAGALAKAVARAGSEVALVTPLHRGILERFPDVHHFDYHLDLPLGPRRVQAQVYRRHWQKGLTVYFIRQPEFFDRPELYQEHGEGYPDNAARFIFFSKCVVHLARYLPLAPQMVHVHDWQVGLVPLFIRHQKSHEGKADGFNRGGRAAGEHRIHSELREEELYRAGYAHHREVEQYHEVDVCAKLRPVYITQGVTPPRGRRAWIA